MSAIDEEAETEAEAEEAAAISDALRKGALASMPSVRRASAMVAQVKNNA